MATAKIVLTDEDGQVNVVIEFGEGGAQEDSHAHHMALQMVRSQLGGLQDEDEDYDD